VTRRSLALLPWALFAQEQKGPPEQEPPEEDEILRPKEYTFNPLQADSEMRVGNFYWKKGSYKAAAKRFEEATRWDPGRAEAFLRWAEALEKLKDKDGARKAYAKYLELAPDAKNAGEIKKKLQAKS
jgi:tetratricopeptide (TPR) repeat protein